MGSGMGIGIGRGMVIGRNDGAAKDGGWTKGVAKGCGWNCDCAWTGAEGIWAGGDELAAVAAAWTASVECAVFGRLDGASSESIGAPTPTDRFLCERFVSRIGSASG